MTQLLEVTHEMACKALARQIIAKHGEDINVLDRLDWIARRVPLGTTGRKIDVIVAVPKGEAITSENICVTAIGLFDDRRNSEAP